MDESTVQDFNELMKFKYLTTSDEPNNFTDKSLCISSRTRQSRKSNPNENKVGPFTENKNNEELGV